MNIGITLTSSLHVGQDYINLTQSIAQTLAEKNHAIVYGGTAYGMMLELAESYKKAGGSKLIGVMSKDLMAVTKGYEAYQNLDETYLCETISERKDTIIEKSEAFLLLPGGYGALEEIVTIVGGKVNKLFDKPIAVYNFEGFYDTLIAFFNELQQKQFSKIKLEEVVLVNDDIETILKYFNNYQATELADKFV